MATDPPRFSQWGRWQNGRSALPPITLIPGGPEVALTGRIWIDTDAACGVTARSDPDDCLAILWLVTQGADIGGVSTSFGNAADDVAADRVADLGAQMAADGLPVPPVFRGFGAPPPAGALPPPGVAALQAALAAGPLTILALGPLTNVAAALNCRPYLQARVSRLVAVIGHRPGHLFHPTEGRGAGAMFGHGPIFRDLNVSVDPVSARIVLAMPMPITLIPYDAARATLVTASDLVDLARQGPAQA